MRICVDIDGTICHNKKPGEIYDDVIPFPDAVQALKDWKTEGHYIILQTARHMRTYNGNEGKILGKLGYLYLWLDKWEIPYDEIYVGKPDADIFIDDKAYRYTNWDDMRGVVRYATAWDNV